MTAPLRSTWYMIPQRLLPSLNLPTDVSVKEQPITCFLVCCYVNDSLMKILQVNGHQHKNHLAGLWKQRPQGFWYGCSRTWEFVPQARCRLSRDYSENHCYRLGRAFQEMEHFIGRYGKFELKKLFSLLLSPRSWYKRALCSPGEYSLFAWDISTGRERAASLLLLTRT